MKTFSPAPYTVPGIRFFGTMGLTMATKKKNASKSSLSAKKSLFLGRYTEQKVERAFEWPMTFLTLALIPVMSIPVLYSLSPLQERIFSFIDIGIWGTFYFEFFTKMFVSRDKVRTFRRNWILALVLLVPSLRLFKLARLARFLRLVRLLRIHNLLQFLPEPPRKLIYHIEYGLAASSALVLISAFLLWFVENQAGGTVRSFGSALWWAVATITTIGYGDVVPTSDVGRVVGAITAFLGVVVFMVITAKVVSYFVHYKVQSENEARIEILLRRLEKIEKGKRVA